MKRVQEEFAFFESLMKGLTAIFGTNCEVVLHDLTESYESTVVMIENGHVTDRRVGDCGSNLGLEVLRGTVRNGDKYGYFTNTRDGRVLRSSSVYVRDDEGKVIGCLCINFDVSNLMVADKTIRSLISSGEGEKEEEFFVNDVNQLLDALLQKAMEEVGKPVSYMTRDDRIRVVKYLDQKGAFLITKSGNRICQFLDISKFTLYSYLDEIHSEIQPSK
ncbi:putative transcriptional regulator YheO [Aminivibrio pyruvatiphilus]|uniref:Putative transcriptional regulator YheO n=1 Tax=Aminivibrio pyruvatiphilus TaxID=1005740 RepID=A0A4R8MBH1_9BACT|nr:helix-turn-helix transcriptional regulator [Aminivibrio pyruvatiphilus]TDY61215.1 putative transcriptional regulator YheO [Aminivibrio pyruvatiphilus]